MRSVAIASFAVTLLCAATQAQQVDSTLRFFEPLMGRTWAGRYVDSPEDAHIQHVVRWQTMLGGRAVKKVKAVAALDFCQVTVYYWDERDDQVSFVSLTNRGQVAHGSVKSDSGHVVLRGSRANGTQFVFSFRVLADGTLQDRFFNVTEGSLRQGHLVEYAADSSDAVSRALECEVEQTEWPGLGYGFQWWTGDSGTFQAIGIHGQLIHVAPARRLVVAINSAWPQAGSQQRWSARDDFLSAIASAIDEAGKN